jgi:hypothetical protein
VSTASEVTIQMRLRAVIERTKCAIGAIEFPAMALFFARFDTHTTGE